MLTCTQIIIYENGITGVNKQKGNVYVTGSSSIDGKGFGHAFSADDITYKRPFYKMILLLMSNEIF